MSSLAPGGSGWLLAICVSRVGSYMVYIAYAATLPVLQREWQPLGHRGGEHRLRLSDRLRGVPDGMLRAGRSRRRAPGVPRGHRRLGGRRAWLCRASPATTGPGSGWYTLLALALGGTYTTGILLVAENVPVERRGRAMGAYLAGHSLGLALALVLTGVAIPRGGYVLAFWLLALGPVVGGVFAWLAVRSTRQRRDAARRRPAIRRARC